VNLNIINTYGGEKLQLLIKFINKKIYLDLWKMEEYKKS